MPKKILLIENDPPFAAAVSGSLEASGFEVRTTGDGKEGLDLARDWAPEAIVLCVELPSLSGYLVCQKLKKDEALKQIPLVLTSAEATEETFDKHKTLKARADDYLLKPYEPEALVEKLGALVGLPEGVDLAADAAAEAAREGDEELVSLEEDIGLDAAPGEPEAEVPGLSLESLPDEPAAEGSGSGLDDDLKLLDDAFDGLSAPPAAHEAAAALDELTGEKPMAGDEVDAAAASLPEEDEGPARADLGGVGDDADAALGALGAADETLSSGLDLAADAPLGGPPRPVRAASADLLRAAGIRLLDEEPSSAASAIMAPPPAVEPAAPRRADAREGGAGDRGPHEALERMREELGDRDAELRDLRRSMETLSRRADEADAELAQARTRVEAAQEKARKAEGEARRAAEQARSAEAEIAELRRKADDAEKRSAAAEQDARRKAEEAAAGAEAISRAEALEREAEELRTELLVARGEADGARGEVERRTADLKKRVAELEAANAKNEERVVKAYQKIKADEKVREKVRKALAIATQLLEEGLPTESPAEKERRAAAAAGRE